ncbi:MAG: plasmid pRiA4b ORF-3 family protein, partial [Deltaproteobacteria bacterium]
YPLKRECPPEECGGEWGYAEFLEKILDPDNEEREELIEWVGGKLDPEHFDLAEIEFSDPVKRFSIAFQGI